MPKTEKIRIPPRKWLANTGRAAGRGVANFFPRMDKYAVAMIGCVFAIIGMLALAVVETVREVSLKKELDEKSSVIVNDRKYTLASPHSVSTIVDEDVTVYYDFESRVKITMTDDETSDSNFPFSFKRFEDLDSPSVAEDARRAGLEISQNLRGAFDDAIDKKFVDDTERYAELSKLAEDFWTTYGDDITKQDGVDSGLDKDIGVIIDPVLAAPLKMEN